MSTFEDYKERVMTEKAELDQRIIKLTAFIEISKGCDDDRLAMARLRTQLFHMEMYSQVLGERIEEFKS